MAPSSLSSLSSSFDTQNNQASDPNKLRLQDYLIKPVQRLCKYPLIFQVHRLACCSLAHLLTNSLVSLTFKPCDLTFVCSRDVSTRQQLIKYTPPTHENYQYMQSTLQKLTELTEHVEECNQQAARERELLEIYSRFHNFPSVRQRGQAAIHTLTGLFEALIRSPTTNTLAPPTGGV